MTSVFRARGWGGGGAGPRNEEAETGTSQGIQCSVWGLWALQCLWQVWQAGGKLRCVSGPQERGWTRQESRPRFLIRGS